MLSDARRVRLAHPLAFPPFAERNGADSAGMIVDVLRACGSRVGFVTEFVAAPFSEVEETLEDGRADAIFPLGIDSQRRRSFDLTEPLFVTGAALFTRRSDPYSAQICFDDLTGKSVTTPSRGPLAGLIRLRFPELKLIQSTSYEESLGQLMTGQADAAALNLQVGAAMVARHWSEYIRTPHAPFVEFPLGVAVRRGSNGWLIAGLDEALASLRADGTLREITLRWTPPNDQ